MRYPELLFVVALILYSVAIWSHKLKKDLKKWMVVVFGAALTLDAFATIVVCALAHTGWAWNFHTITGLASLIIMAAHFFWAVAAIMQWGNWRVWFDRCSIYAWILWLFAFFSGIPPVGKFLKNLL